MFEIDPTFEINLMKACMGELEEFLSKLEFPTLFEPPSVPNQCPTLDNKINCSECTHECKLRMQLEQSKEDIPPEYPPAVIYY